MDIKEISLLIDAVSKAEIKNFHLQKGDFSLAMDKLNERNPIEVHHASSATLTLEKPSKVDSIKEDVIHEVVEKKSELKSEIVSETVERTESITTTAKIDTTNCVQVKSPIVGTYYSAAGPDQDPFVKVGDKVKKGQILCIVEAMKLMNDIESDVNGEIVEILVNNGDMVEYNQPIFTVRPN